MPATPLKALLRRSSDGQKPSVGDRTVAPASSTATELAERKGPSGIALTSGFGCWRRLTVTVSAMA